MMDKRYSIAISETLHYLKGINQDDVDKIPKRFMLFLKENADDNYSCDFDYNKPLKELNLKDETRGLIAMICLNYWCETEEQKNEFSKHLNKNEQKYQEELKKIYNTDNLFKKNNSDNREKLKSEIKNELPAEIKKQNAFIRLINWIKKMIHKK